MRVEKKISQKEIMERSSSYIYDCASLCLRLQDTLSKILEKNSSIETHIITEIQELDKLSQQLSDISGILCECAHLSSDNPAIYERTLKASSRLDKTRSSYLANDHPQNSAGDCDLF